MALIRQFSKNGVDYPAAYSKIESIRCDKNNAYVFVCTYANEDSRFAGEYPVHAEEIITSLLAVNSGVFPGAYQVLKGYSEFEGAEDHFAVEGVIETNLELMN